MKILFVYTDINVRGGARSYQFGIGSISAVLKQHGHETKLHYMFSDLKTDELLREIEEYKPGLLLFPAVSPQYPHVYTVLKALPASRPFTVLGAHHATLHPECLMDTPNLDAICIGEGEYPMLELADAFEKGAPIDHIQNLWIKKPDGTIIKNPTRPFIRDLNELPFPDRELFDMQAVIDSDFKTALFMFSRGCPYNCTFCSNHALRTKQEGKYVRFRSVEKCIEEIRDVTGKYDVRTLYFNDDCFTASKQFVAEFCTAYKKEFTYPFDINARPETLNDEICSILKDAGCRRISIGIESGDETFRREVLNRKMDNDAIVRAFDCCRRAGIKTKSFNIVGFPRETPEMHQETVRLNARINPDSVIIGIFEPYPGTKLAQMCLDDGILGSVHTSGAFIGRTDTVLDMPQFPREEIIRCFRTFAYNVYKGHSLKKALMLRIYYSRYGQFLARCLGPVKDKLRTLVMGV
ncbi:B12-binding domain-containing radical SAM protein [Desulfonatronum thioautotrophicum]|uniref:B12-binding domain-containing radical SAM protein n=1 Tax=Desulfonatronum thioautotrophicum TaxID=617001 RepID=UPI0005EBBC30|nr:radical SAM protein [Desulfonatronum thioautotrophicum]